MLSSAESVLLSVLGSEIGRVCCGGRVSWSSWSLPLGGNSSSEWLYGGWKCVELASGLRAVKTGNSIIYYPTYFEESVSFFFFFFSQFGGSFLLF